MIFTSLVLVSLIFVSSHTITNNYGPSGASYRAPLSTHNRALGHIHSQGRLAPSQGFIAPSQGFVATSQGFAAPSTNTYPKQQALPIYLPKAQAPNYNPALTPAAAQGFNQDGTPVLTTPTTPTPTTSTPVSVSITISSSTTSPVQTDLNNLGPDFSTATTTTNPANVMTSTPSVATLRLQGSGAADFIISTAVKVSILSLLATTL